MKLSDVSILISPGYGSVESDHWQCRWARQMKTGQFVDHKEYVSPKRDDWVGDLVLAVEKADMPVMLVGHSLGCVVIAHAAPFFAPEKVAGAFLVAPSDWERKGLITDFDEHDFAPIPRAKFAFPSLLVASRNDEYCSYERAESFANSWGSKLQDAGEAGHINVASGQGPWPEGLTAFALFLKTLG